MRIKSLIIFCLIVLGINAAFDAHDAAGAQKRGRVIDFDDEVVEGMNKRPYDSLSHLSDAEKNRRKNHLYRKRTGFSSETADTLKTLRYIQ